VVKQTDKGEIIACPVPAVIEKIQGAWRTVSNTGRWRARSGEEEV
jgi:hypothetical protein